jgi:uncharacterized protein YjeT (DUF2065 family)
MDVIVYLLGFGHIAASACLILYTKESIAWLKSLINQYRLKHWAAIPAVFGLLFLISASAVTFPWFFRIIGLLAFCESAIAFTNPHNIYRRMLDWYFGNVSNQANRLFGIIGLVFGTVILTWVK